MPLLPSVCPLDGTDRSLLGIQTNRTGVAYKKLIARHLGGIKNDPPYRFIQGSNGPYGINGGTRLTRTTSCGFEDPDRGEVESRVYLSYVL